MSFIDFMIGMARIFDLGSTIKLPYIDDDNKAIENDWETINEDFNFIIKRDNKVDNNNEIEITAKSEDGYYDLQYHYKKENNREDNNKEKNNKKWRYAGLDENNIKL